MVIFNEGAAGTNKYISDDLVVNHQIVQDSAGNSHIEAGLGVTDGAIGANAQVIIGIFAGASSALYMSAATPVTGNAGADGRTGIVIGAAGNDSAFWDGNIAEIAVWNRALTAAEVTKLLQYTADRYGIAVGP